MLKALLSSVPEEADKEFSLDAGTVKWGHEAQIGYFPQDVSGLIQHGMTVSDWLHQFDPRVTREEIRGLLGRCSSAARKASNPPRRFQREKNGKAPVCRLMLLKPNILILDEPTTTSISNPSTR